MNYPGGKGGAGVYQTIINLIPPHDVYIEAFAGGANIFERKKSAKTNILVERNWNVVEELRKRHYDKAFVVYDDAISYLAKMAATDTKTFDGNIFIYLDPPYVLSTRTKKKIYGFEMTDLEHMDLLSILAVMPPGVNFMLSGYRNAMYDEAAEIHGWHRVDFQAMTRRGLKTESIWMNYQPPAVIADYAYAGQNFRERERIKRKISRWVERLKKLPAIERAALLSAMQDLEVKNSDEVPDGTSEK